MTACVKMAATIAPGGNHHFLRKEDGKGWDSISKKEGIWVGSEWVEQQRIQSLELTLYFPPEGRTLCDLAGNQTNILTFMSSEPGSPSSKPMTSLTG